MMGKPKRMTLAVATCLAAARLAAAAELAVDDVIGRHVQARGGAAKLAALQSRRLSGWNDLGGKEGKAPFAVELKRPRKVRSELTVHGKTVIRTYDGAAGWMQDPWSGRPGPRPLLGDELGNIAAEADFDGPLVDYRARGNQVELLGREPVRGKEAYKLRVTLAGGLADVYYIDAGSFLQVKWQGTRMVNGKPRQFSSYFGDFRDVQGLKFPHLIESESPGGPARKIVFEKVELNPRLDDSRFTLKPAS